MMKPNSIRTVLFMGLAGIAFVSGCSGKPPAEKAEAAEKGEQGEEGENEEKPEAAVMTDEAARMAGVVVASAGPASIDEMIDISGRIEITPEGKGEVRAWYPGRIMSMSAQIGQSVRKGQVIARVESSESLQSYSIPATLSGVVMEKNANVGDVTFDRPLYVIANPNSLQASFFLFPNDAGNVRVGQGVSIQTLGGGTINSTVSAILSSVDPQTQTMTAIVKLPASALGDLRPGMAVEGKFVTGQGTASVAVPSDALQTFEGRQVVFIKQGTSYKPRPVQIGRQSAQWTEIVEGLASGESYVAKGAFLIRADIEKSTVEED